MSNPGFLLCDCTLSHIIMAYASLSERDSIITDSLSNLNAYRTKVAAGLKKTFGRCNDNTLLCHNDSYLI